jgi:orotidine-5'-phosphate decarboxylase
VIGRESQVVLGLDPDPRRLWPEAAAAADDLVDATPRHRAAAAVLAQCRALVDAAGPACVAIKPQVACFERLGAPGWAALAAACDYGRAAGLLVICDAKRGDVDVSAAAYGEAFFGGLATPWGTVSGLQADGLTANPLLGADALAPLLAAGRAVGGGLLVLVRTSNPGAADVQERALAEGGDVAERLARMVDVLGRPGRAGVSDVGAVVGATAPERLARLRELMPHAPILLPGVGAQGGRVEALAPAFDAGPAGGLVAASRAIAHAHDAAGGDPATAARGEAERLRRLAWSLV